MKKYITWLLLTIAVWPLACAPEAVKTAIDAEKTYDVIVIGAGGGGLGAAARLSLAGKRVLVLEQHHKVGGYMTAFERGDYTFEVSLHAMDGLDPGGLTNAAFRKLGILDRIKPVRLDPMYRACFPQMALDVPADIEQYRKLLKERFPGEAEGLDRLFAALDRIDRAFAVGTKFIDGRFCGALWEGIKHPRSLGTMLKYWDATLSELLGDFIHDRQLISVFTQLSGFLGDGPDRISGLTFAAMWNSYHRHGYYYVQGGSQSVSDALAEVIRENGGEIKTAVLVTKILVQDGRAVGVQTKDGGLFRGRRVISNANAPDTLFKLVGREHLPESYAAKVAAMEIAAAAFVAYLGVDMDYSGHFPHHIHELMINKSADQAANYQPVGRDGLADAPYVITNYSMVDPATAPPGKNVITLTTLLPYDWHNGWHEADGYDRYTAFKNSVAEELVRQAEVFLPDLRSHIEIMEVGSPRTMKHYTLNPGGSMLGWANTPGQSLFKRLPQETPIENLWLAGAWTFPCGGQSAVIMSGVLAAESVLKTL